MCVVTSPNKILDIKNYNQRILDELNRLAIPIENYGIKLLTFRRIYYDTGDMIHLSNDPAWLDYSYDHELWQSTSSMGRIQNIGINEQYAHVWQSSNTDYVYEAMYQHNLCNGITIYDKRDKYVDLWAFATERNNTEIFDLYVNKLFVIKQFIMYLHDKAYSLLMPNDFNIFIKTDKVIDPCDKQTAIPNGQLFNIDKYYYDSDLSCYLTRQEFLCLYNLSQGKSCKEISKILGISHRTVEGHLNSIRKKTGTNFKSNLLENCKYLLNMYK